MKLFFTLLRSIKPQYAQNDRGTELPWSPRGEPFVTHLNEGIYFEINWGWIEQKRLCQDRSCTSTDYTNKACFTLSISWHREQTAPNSKHQMLQHWRPWHILKGQSMRRGWGLELGKGPVTGIPLEFPLWNPPLAWKWVFLHLGAITDIYNLFVVFFPLRCLNFIEYNY